MTDLAVAPRAALPATVASLDAHVPHRRGRAALRALAACVVLLSIYGVLSLFNDARGTIVSDSGGKLATLRVMDERGSAVPDVGYWARAYDPDGTFHPLVYTRRIGDQFVQVTTLPMLELAFPLYELGGIRAALLLPMLGGVLTALGARALARRLGGGSGWPTFWAVGLLTPMAIYALDFWEHALGVALMLWGVVCLTDVLRERGGWSKALWAGVLFGAAATLRTESFVYLVAATGAVCALLAVRHAWKRAWATAALVAGGALTSLVLNSVLERIVIGADLRSARAAGTAASSGAALSTRIHEALTSTIGIGFGGLRLSSDWFLGALIAILVGAGAIALRSNQQRVVVLGVIADVMAVLLYVARFGKGLGFVPGLVVASPLAAAGLFVCWRDKKLRSIALTACVALPMVWASQYTGSMWPQWGGRYVLLSGVLLAVAACVALAPNRRAFIATCLVAGCVTGGGLVWLSVRTHTNVQGMEKILARHDDVLIARHSQLFREVGAFYTPSSHWLTVADDSELPRAVRIARESGAQELATIGPEGQAIPRRLGAYERGHTELIAFTRPDVRVQVTTYRLSPGRAGSGAAESEHFAR